MARITQYRRSGENNNKSKNKYQIVKLRKKSFASGIPPASLVIENTYKISALNQISNVCCILHHLATPWVCETRAYSKYFVGNYCNLIVTSCHRFYLFRKIYHISSSLTFTMLISLIYEVFIPTHYANAQYTVARHRQDLAFCTTSCILFCSLLYLQLCRFLYD